MTNLPWVPAEEGAPIHASSLDLSDDSSFQVSFLCDGKAVAFQFLHGDTKVGDRINVSRSDAMTFGAQAEKTGISDFFRIAGLDVEAVRSFGRRLWLYGKDGK